MTVRESDFGEISSILDGYFSKRIRTAILERMNPCFKKDLGHSALSGKKLDKTPLGKGGGDTIDLRTRTEKLFLHSTC